MGERSASRLVDEDPRESAVPLVPPCWVAKPDGVVPPACASPESPLTEKWFPPGSTPVATATVPSATAAETPSRPVRTGVAAFFLRCERVARRSASRTAAKP
nr:hypothetical protein [Streptomyces cynarae]